jgi:imidazolonepropionase-like amidohydrolase
LVHRLSNQCNLLGTVGRLLLSSLLTGLIVVMVAPSAWPQSPRQPPTVLIVGKVYVSPDQPPLGPTSITLLDGKIQSIGPAMKSGAQRSTVGQVARQGLRCDHCVLTAGFWNAHVHFTEAKWNGAGAQAAPKLDGQLTDMLLSRGFTTVVDTASDPTNTVALRRRIESGELKGPRIYTAGGALYPPHAIPFYVRDAVPPEVLSLLAQPATAKEAVADVERNFAIGADLLKLFTGSYVARGHVVPMPLDIAKAAVDDAHAHGKLVFSHPSDLAGTRVAMDAGVDVLAHAPDSPAGIDAALIQRMVDQHMAMIPTLKMFATTGTTNPAYLAPIYAEVRQFHTMGGQLLFGTDVGYMTDYTTAGEFQGLVESGLSPMDMLRMLTTAPADRFKVSDHTGTLAPGMDADLVLLNGDPAQDVKWFSEVRCTIRQGKVVYGNCGE